jgi:hypothetical protein
LLQGLAKFIHEVDADVVIKAYADPAEADPTAASRTRAAHLKTLFVQ